MAARVHEVARDAAERLGFDEPFTLYQTPKERPYTSAQALLNERPFAIRLIGPVAKLLDDAALRALIGHELGHALALGPRADPPSRILSAWDYDAPRELLRLCDVALELTAERFAVLAAGELDAIVRLEVAMYTLDSPAALGVRAKEHLENVCRRVERGGPSLLDSSGPTSDLRVYADWLFWRSDAYQELTGTGPGDLALRDVDARLRQLCEAASKAAPLRPEPAPEADSTEATPARPGATKPHSTPRVPSARDAAHAAIASLAATVGDIASRAAKQFLAEPPEESEPPLDIDPLDELDECEQRFRALEAAADDASRPADVPPDLEARFRELEARDAATTNRTVGQDGADSVRHRRRD
jgi:hypothetical protein